jgi:hypothetical protein
MTQKRCEEIGLKGVGFNIELEIIKETAKAYLVKDQIGAEFWIPKSAFDEFSTAIRYYEKAIAKLLNMKLFD